MPTLRANAGPSRRVTWSVFGPCARSWLGASILTLLLASASTAADQPFCQLQKVEVERVSNALRIKLVADGMMRLTQKVYDDFWTQERGWWELAGKDRIEFKLGNVRGAPAPIIQIAQYPVSHLEFSLPPDDTANVGLTCTLVLYKPGYVSAFRGKDDDWDMTAWYYQWPQVMILPTKDENQITITVLTDRVGEPEAARPEIEGAQTSLTVRGTAGDLTLRALNADIHETLIALSRRSQVPISVDDGLARKVTGNFDHMPLRRLLQALSTAYGLAVCEDRDGYFVAACDSDRAGSAWTATTRTVTLNYLRPGQAQLLLPEVLLPYVKPNMDANSLTISGSAALVDRAEADLRVIDQPGYQCRIRTWLVSAQSGQTDLQSLLAKSLGGTTALSGSSAGELSIRVGDQQATDALMSLRALARENKLQISAMPSLTCNTGTSASLFVGQQIYYWRLTSGYGQEVQLTSAEAGSRLSISPRAAGDCVTAWVDVENSFLGEMNDLGPMILRRKASSLVRMASGDLLVIGGLRQGSNDAWRSRTGTGLPLDAVLTGKLKQRQQGEVYVLVRAEAWPSAPVEPLTQRVEARTGVSQ